MAGNKRAGYKLATYRTSEGPRAGIVIGDEVFDAAKLTGKAPYATVAGILADWKTAEGALRKAAAGAAKSRVKRQPLSKTKLLAPVPHPPTIFCAGANYADHAAAMARKHGMPEPADPHEQGLKPWHFIKAARTLADPGATIKATALRQGAGLGDRACRRHRPTGQGCTEGKGAVLRRRLHRSERSFRARSRPPTRHRSDLVLQDGLEQA